MLGFDVVYDVGHLSIMTQSHTPRDVTHTELVLWSAILTKRGREADESKRITYSRYLAQNATIWLADEVLRYRDYQYDTSRCQDDISWHLITQQSKRRNANNGLRIIARKSESTHIHFERYQC